MNCKDVQNLLSPYLDQALNPEEMQFIQDHLNHCALCEQELRRLRRTIGIIHGLQEVPLPEDFQRQLHHKLIVASKEIKRKKTIWLKLFTRSPWASAGIAALFLLVFYTCFSQVLPREQSDSTVPGTISEQKSASLHDNNWQQANKTTDTGKGTGVSVPLSEKNQKSQENQKVKNPAKGSQEKTVSPAISNKENITLKNSSQEDNSFKEENRQNGGQAARGENKAPPVPKAKAPYSSEEKNSQKTKDQASTQSSIMAIEGIQSGTALKAEKKVNHNIHNIIVELQIGTEEYAQVYQQINDLPSKMSVDVCFETDREEKNSGEFTITVLPASTEQVLSLLRSMGEILSQSSSNTDISSKLSNAEKKLSDLMAEKNRLEKLLKEELSTEEQQRTNDEIKKMQREIESTTLDLENLRKKTDYDTIKVIIKEKVDQKEQ